MACVVEAVSELDAVGASVEDVGPGEEGEGFGGASLLPLRFDFTSVVLERCPVVVGRGTRGAMAAPLGFCGTRWAAREGEGPG